MRNMLGVVPSNGADTLDPPTKPHPRKFRFELGGRQVVDVCT